MSDIQYYLEKLRAGDKLALSRVLTHVENNTPEGIFALETLFPQTGRAHMIGITGSPGTGKSTLVNSIAMNLRKKPEAPRVAIIAVDPSSPYSGGALLGDRVRMRDLHGDQGIFIRSMASRGALGGLSHRTAALAQVLDAAGFEIILIETVGAGQSEVEIASLAHTVIVVEAPGMGDEIQAIKAGILEIANILVVNKADRPGAENSTRALRAMLQMAHPGDYMPMARKHLFNALESPTAAPEQSQEIEIWTPPVVQTIATEGNGLDELMQAIEDHLAYLKRGQGWAMRDKENLALEMEGLIREHLTQRWLAQMPEARLEEVMLALQQRKISPHQALEKLLTYN